MKKPDDLDNWWNLPEAEQERLRGQGAVVRAAAQELYAAFQAKVEDMTTEMACSLSTSLAGLLRASVGLTQGPPALTLWDSQTRRCSHQVTFSKPDGTPLGPLSEEDEP